MAITGRCLSAGTGSSTTSTGTRRGMVEGIRGTPATKQVMSMRCLEHAAVDRVVADTGTRVRF